MLERGESESKVHRPQCLQHAVSLICNFNPKFQYLWSPYPYFVLRSIIIKSQLTHAALANFPYFQFCSPY